MQQNQQPNSQAMNSKFSHELIFIGCLLRNPGAIVECDILADDFSSLQAKEIYQAIKSVYSEGGSVCLPTVFERTGRQYAHFLSEAVDLGGLGYAPRLADEIRNGAKRRFLSSKVTGLADMMKSGQYYTAEDAITDLGRIYHDSLDGVKTKRPSAISDIVSGIVTRNSAGERPKCFETGFSTMEHKAVTFMPSHLWVMGGFTSVGKTAVMVEMVGRALAVNTVQPKTVIFSSEMTAEQITGRFVASHVGKMSSTIYLRGMIHTGDLIQRRISQAELDLSKQPLHIFDNETDIDRIANELRRLKMTSGVDLVFVDFIQNLKKRGKYHTRREMFVDIALDLQALAKELECCIVVLSQIPASAAKENTGILEYKEAGEIANACDIGIWLTRAKDDKQVMLVDVKKNRHGEVFKMALRFTDYWTRLVEIIQEEGR